MSRDWRWFLSDLMVFCERILEYSAGLNQAELLTRRLNLDAILRNIETLGEAAKHIPPEVRGQLPEVPWPKLIGMRNALIHEYFGLDNNVMGCGVEQDTRLAGQSAKGSGRASRMV